MWRHSSHLCQWTCNVYFWDPEIFCLSFNVQILFQVDEPPTNGTKNGKESSKEPDSIDDDDVEDVDIDDI